MPPGPKRKYTDEERAERRHVSKVTYRQRHPERIAESAQRYRDSRPPQQREVMREKGRAYMRQDYIRKRQNAVWIPKWTADNPEWFMFRDARMRARKCGLPFDIPHWKDLAIPGICPVLGIPIQRGNGARCDSSPTLDRIVPELGYVLSNVRVISWRANRLKNDATAAELRLIADYIDRGG